MRVKKVEPAGSFKLREYCLGKQTDLSKLNQIVEEAYNSADVPKDGTLVIFPDFVIMNNGELEMFTLERGAWLSIDTWLEGTFYIVE